MDSDRRLPAAFGRRRFARLVAGTSTTAAVVVLTGGATAAAAEKPSATTTGRGSGGAARALTELVPDPVVHRVATGAKWAEGPVWLPDRGCVRFSDVRSNRILEYYPGATDFTVYNDDPDFTNGRTLDRSGAVVQCSHGKRRVEVDNGHSVRPVVERWAGKRFNAPNDVVVASDGTVWFTDPYYGLKVPAEGHGGSEEYGDHYVFRFDPATRDIRPVVTDVVMPNGLAFSPDEKLLYVSDTSAASADGVPLQGAGHAIHVYDVTDGRKPKNGRTFAVIDPGVPDGLRVDEHGNVWTSSKSGVQIYRPDGHRIGEIPVPEQVANLCFGGPDGRTLWITASTSLYQVETTVRDASTAWRAAYQAGD